MIDVTLEQFIPAFLLTLFAGLSTGFGALIAFFSKNKSHTFLSIGLGFSAGVMVYVSFVEILSKSKIAFSTIYESPIIGESLALVCFFGGISISALIDRLIPDDVNPHEPKSNKELSVLKEGSQHSLLKDSALKRTGIFTALAIGIHNFPEGFATFIAALDNIHIGLTIAPCDRYSQYTRGDGGLFAYLPRHRKSQECVLVCVYLRFGRGLLVLWSVFFCCFPSWEN